MDYKELIFTFRFLHSPHFTSGLRLLCITARQLLNVERVMR